MKTTRVITSAADPAMLTIRHIYRNAFPESERKPIEALDQMVERSDYTFAVIEEHSTTIGFAILFTPTGSDDAALLEYLAIDSGHQGGRAGTALVQFVVELSGARPLLIEVESSTEPIAQRRREFYRRIGFRTVRGLDYIVPLPNSPAMELMVVNRPGQIDSHTLAGWLTRIYQCVYSCACDDPRLVNMLFRLPPKL